jgi:hypothetical protein
VGGRAHHLRGIIDETAISPRSSSAAVRVPSVGIAVAAVAFGLYTLIT